MLHFLKKLRLKFLQNELDALTKAPEYQKILKKYDIKPVNHNDTELRYQYSKEEKKEREKEEKKSTKQITIS